MNFRRLIACGWVVGALAWPVGAAEADRFPLGKAAPDDVYIFVAARHNPERQFLDDYWGQVIDAFHKSGFVDDVWDLISENISDEDIERVEEITDQCRKLIGGVCWGELFGGEMVYMGRAAFPVWEHAVLVRGTAGSAEKNFTGLNAILTEVRKLVGEAVVLEESQYEGATLMALRTEGAPFAAWIARRGDVIGLGIGDKLLKDALKLLAGQAKNALVTTERFKAAFAQLPPAEDSMVFFDVAQLGAGLGSMLDAVEKLERAQVTTTAEASVDPDARKVFGMVRGVIRDLAFVDYVAETERTEGYRVFTDGYTPLTADARSRAGFKIFVESQRVDRFDRFVPKEATGFSVECGVDFRALYQWILKTLREGVPGGEAMMAQWEQFQEEMEFHLDRDVLSWIEGSFISVELPGRGMGGGDWVMLAKVRDEKKATRQIKRGLKAISEKLGEQPLIQSDVEIEGKASFHKVTHPFLMMVQVPGIIWGTDEGYLIFGSSQRAISRCLKTAAGKHPSIRQSERFQGEGIMPRGDIVSASFADTSRTAEELQAALSGVTFGMGMVTAFAPIPEEGGGRVIKAIPGLLSKLVPVAAKLDFFQSESSATTFDGKAWRTVSVVNYKDPATMKKTVEEENGNGDDEDDEREDDDEPAPVRSKAPWSERSRAGDDR